MLATILPTLALCFAVGLASVGAIGAFTWFGARNGIEFITASASIDIRRMGRTAAFGAFPISGAVIGFMALNGLLAELQAVALVCVVTMFGVAATVGTFTWQYVKGNDEYLVAASPLRIHKIGRFVAITTAPIAVTGLGLLATGFIGTVFMAAGLATPAFLASRARRRYQATGRFL